MANVAKRFTELYLQILLDRKICMSTKDLAFGGVFEVCNSVAGYIAGEAVRRLGVIGATMRRRDWRRAWVVLGKAAQS